MGTTPEPFGLSSDTIENLKRRGHALRLVQPRFMGGVQGIMIEPDTGIRLGGSDGRRAGQPAGY